MRTILCVCVAHLCAHGCRLFVSHDVSVLWRSSAWNTTAHANGLAIENRFMRMCEFFLGKIWPKNPFLLHDKKRCRYVMVGRRCGQTKPVASAFGNSVHRTLSPDFFSQKSDAGREKILWQVSGCVLAFFLIYRQRAFWLRL